MPRQLRLFEPSEIPADAAIIACRQQARAVKRTLHDFYSDESNFNFQKVGEETVFPDGKPWVFCWAWAGYVRRHHGRRARLYSFDSQKNPWSFIADRCGGHHFALLDKRFIVDGWLPNVEGFDRRAVFDLVGAGDEQVIRRLYGPPEMWLLKCRTRGIELDIDREDAAVRTEALQGVTRPPEIPVCAPLPSRFRDAELSLRRLRGKRAAR